MNRVIVYPQALLQDTDILNIERNVMISLGFLAQMCVGTGTVVDGLSCTPTSPASMVVNVGPGSILFNTVVDENAFGSLAADTTDALVKTGVNLTSTPFTITAPSTSGYSQMYVIQAAFSETDGNSVLLPYYNASDPSVPYSGPDNSGTAQNTTRSDTVNLELLAGTPAATGSETLPALTSGFVGLWVITVENGQTTITSSSISEYPNAPFVQYKLGTLQSNVRTRLSSNLNLYVSPSGSDTANTGLSSGSPFATIQHAVNFLQNSYDLAGYIAYMNLANGTYTAGATVNAPFTGAIGSGSVVIVGNTSSPADVVVTTASATSSTFFASSGAQFTVSGMTISATGSGGSGAPGFAIEVGADGYIVIESGVVFGACANGHICANGSGGCVGVGAPYTIAGSTGTHVFATFNGIINMFETVVTLTGTPSFSTAFAIASTNGTLYSAGDTFNGSATGVRYVASYNGCIITNGGGANYFPGNSAGSTPAGGQYD